MSADLQWFKSSYSGDQGECLEVALEWMRSSWSDGEGECGEIASSTHTIHIRDSKNPTTPHLTISPTAWAAFLRNSAAMTDTVNAALEGAIKRRKRASFLGWLAEGGLPDLTGPIERPADTRQ
ncbi:DUF397 domain-containing protein [Streptomyces griseosporeus]|uniref:DUF397 domain-containing protein n=1 Tax=Streptomyces griseosporeus TaxID=1910 RepID=UPI00167DE49C|nr:DUF397 domain-containing protein [Streptomyces griseosporeus]GHF79465.1 hypothetical protein GCM10018783_57270 [Streptomyces griseosporeus]